MAEAFGIACHELVSLDFRCGSTTEVSDGHENVRSWVTSGSRIWAAGGLLVATSSHRRLSRTRLLSDHKRHPAEATLVLMLTPRA